MSIAQLIAQELSVNIKQVETVIELLDEGSTVPFIARYRKEKTGGLDDTQLRTLDERLHYLRELHKRRESIFKSIDEQGKLTDELKSALNRAKTQTELEDLYLPYKRKRRTKAQMAREAGLEPLAMDLLENPTLNPEQESQKYIDSEKDINDSKEALEGARFILMEHFAENATLIGELRDYLWAYGIITSKVMKNKEAEGEKFKDYFEYNEAINKIPSHRALALFRGRSESILSLKLDVIVEDGKTHPCQVKIAQVFKVGNVSGANNQTRAADDWLLETVRFAWRVKIHTKLSIDLMLRLRERSEQEAINVFSQNLSDLLLAAPAGDKATMGLDPGIRTGVKVAVVDATGKLLDTATIYPHQPRNQWDQSIEILNKLAKKHSVELISIGNGTASRETDKLTADLMKRYPDLTLSKIITSEAGASVYSASAFAANEFPNLDVSLRGAVSIARRLQDPLAELVKIEPKAIGVGQYQHDVNQVQLSRSLDSTVEDCVNAVGVDVNTASAALLSHIAGLNMGLAENIVSYRDDNGVFTNRKQLKKVARLGPKAFEQSAGFLRIRNGDNPLDASAVHPEAYSVVNKVAKNLNKKLQDLIGDSTIINQLKPTEYVDDNFGLPTIKDIFAELDKPGRDPRPEFVTATFKEGVDNINDLYEGMILEGVVSNVTNFGAFVDIGVHQDGLVHISQLADRFVKDPRDVVKAGDVVTVKVESVDAKRKRIALTMKLTEAKPSAKKPKNKPAPKANTKPAGNSAMADALQGLKK